MRDISLLQLALGLAPPWTVTGSDFDAEARRLDIHIDFAAGSHFACPGCGAAHRPAHDTERMTWRHLNFLQHQAYLHARVPRVRCVRCGVRRSACHGRARVAASLCYSRRWSWPWFQQCRSTLWPDW